MRDKLLTLEEAKEYLRIKKVTLYKLVRSGNIPASKVGRQWRFKKDRIDNWLRRQEVAYNKNRKNFKDRCGIG
jgi:PTS system nitrogen regulatory IIA component